MRLNMFRPAMLAVVLGVSLFHGNSQAGLLPVTATVTADGDNQRWSYGVVLTSDSILRTNDFFTIYDFKGLLGEYHVEPEGFAFSVTQTGPTPNGIVPVDDPTIDNITWTYTGPDTVVGPLGLGTFMVQSSYAQKTDGVFSSRTHRQVDGRVDSNITTTDVPVPTSSGVPEPATLALFGVGLPLAGLLRRRMR
jgi:hypothetical protein